MKPVERRISELCVEYRFGDAITPETSDRVLRAYAALRSAFDAEAYGILDVIPTYTALAVHFSPHSPLVDDTAPLHDAVAASGGAAPLQDGKTVTVDVVYDGEDVAHVCEATGLDRDALVTLHSEKPYRIAMLGFRPYFPYLLGLDPKLALPRRETPRKKVPKGSVAIAAGQTGIYSEDSPGGWHIIGRTAFDAFETLRPGDTLVFRSVPC